MAQVIRLKGLTPYGAAHHLQQTLIEKRLLGEIGDTLLLLEHAPVITLGRKRFAEQNLLLTGDTPVIAVERGGDATWHGPGQLVAYPILLLEGKKADLHRHLRNLEEAVIATLAHFGLEGRRDARNSGVWLEKNGITCKVCSVGIACRRWVTWHGLALNINPDPRVWEQIRPCGFSSDVMTRMADHLENPPLLEEVIEPLAENLGKTLEIDLKSWEELEIAV